ncbi:acetate CoA/acetoacetate CoA-transferase beta subunit [Enterococcus sp. PF1-24]|nr:acetate CoA/acetoacetate CoA-transferase beta subunit [Enterococcus sp. PFB1-1]MDH6401895.1 acetate CoA/acetoacetate CoA-transferase beta subunit [Enterococcus sp. PF1-24]
MNKNEKKFFIASRVAKEFKDGDFVNLGIGLPTLIPEYLPQGISIVLQSENGIVGVGRKKEADNGEGFFVTDAGGNPASVTDYGAFIDSGFSFSLIRGGHVDFTVLGALEVDEAGNLANWIIPGKIVPGMGGAMDLVVGTKKVIIAMEHTAKGKHKILKECTLPLTATKCVDLIITEMAVFEVNEKGLILTEYNPEFTLADIKANTSAIYQISENLKSMI